MENASRAFKSSLKSATEAPTSIVTNPVVPTM